MFPSRLAFGFLEDIAKEFWKQNSSEIPTVVRPYSFIEFGRLSCVWCYKYEPQTEQFGTDKAIIL